MNQISGCIICAEALSFTLADPVLDIHQLGLIDLADGVSFLFVGVVIFAFIVLD